MHQNVSLGFNGVDRVRSLRKIPTRLRGTNFCTSSARCAPSFVRQHQFRVQWGVLGAFVAKKSDATSWHKLLHWFVPFCTEFCKATKWFRMHKIVRNALKHQFRVQWGWIRCVRCEKFRSPFVARTFALFWPVLHRVP